MIGIDIPKTGLGTGSGVYCDSWHGNKTAESAPRPWLQLTPGPPVAQLATNQPSECSGHSQGASACLPRQSQSPEKAPQRFSLSHRPPRASIGKDPCHQDFPSIACSAPSLCPLAQGSASRIVRKSVFGVSMGSNVSYVVAEHEHLPNGLWKTI